MKLLSKIIMLPLLLLYLPPSFAADPTFPGRSQHPGIAVIELKDLAEQLDKFVIVDTRSKLEFDTLHIKGAVNLTITDPQFGQHIQALHARHAKPLVFYCNGRACFKSYHAVKEAKRRNISQAYAFDAGIYDWSRSYPQHSVLLGKSPVDKNDIVSEEHFEQRQLDAEQFAERVTELGPKSMVIDVRDKNQRAGAGIFGVKERWITLDDREKLQEAIEQAIKEKRTLFIYDEVGKQVQWLQYVLVRSGLKDYYFLRGGANGYFTKMMNDNGIKVRQL